MAKMPSMSSVAALNLIAAENGDQHYLANRHCFGHNFLLGIIKSDWLIR